MICVWSIFVLCRVCLINMNEWMNEQFAIWGPHIAPALTTPMHNCPKTAISRPLSSFGTGPWGCFTPKTPPSLSPLFCVGNVKNKRASCLPHPPRPDTHHAHRTLRPPPACKAATGRFCATIDPRGATETQSDCLSLLLFAFRAVALVPPLSMGSNNSTVAVSPNRYWTPQG